MNRKGVSANILLAVILVGLLLCTSAAADKPLYNVYTAKNNLLDLILDMWTNKSLLLQELFFSDHEQYKVDNFEPLSNDMCWIILNVEEGEVQLIGKNSDDNWMNYTWDHFNVNEMMGLCMAMCKTWDAYTDIGNLGIAFLFPESRDLYITDKEAADEFVLLYLDVYGIEEENPEEEAEENEQRGFSNNPVRINEAARSVMMLEVYDSKGKYVGSGSGFVAFDNRHLVTNYHVLENADVIHAYSDSGDTYFIMDVCIADSKKDIAILEFFSPTDLQPLTLYEEGEVIRATPVVAIGSPKGFSNTISTGIVSSVYEFDECTYIQFTAPISSGSSGGALFNDDGEVIGVTSMSYEDENGFSQNLNFAVNISEVIELFIHWNGQKYRLFDIGYADVNFENQNEASSSESNKNKNAEAATLRDWLGTIDGNQYINELAGLRYTIGDMSFYREEDILSLTENVSTEDLDKDVNSVLARIEGNAAVVMLAISSDSMRNMTMTIMDMTDYMEDLSAKGLKSLMEDMINDTMTYFSSFGAENIVCKIIEREIGNETFYGVEFSCTYMDEPIYQKEIVTMRGNIMVMLTVTCYEMDKTENVLASWAGTR